jgi:hypothetical protein
VDHVQHRLRNLERAIHRFGLSGALPCEWRAKARASAHVRLRVAPVRVGILTQVKEFPSS